MRKREGREGGAVAVACRLPRHHRTALGHKSLSSPCPTPFTREAPSTQRRTEQDARRQDIEVIFGTLEALTSHLCILVLQLETVCRSLRLVMAAVLPIDGGGIASPYRSHCLRDSAGRSSLLCVAAIALPDAAGEKVSLLSSWLSPPPPHPSRPALPRPEPTLLAIQRFYPRVTWPLEAMLTVSERVKPHRSLLALRAASRCTFGMSSASPVGVWLRKGIKSPLCSFAFPFFSLFHHPPTPPDPSRSPTP